MINSLEKLQDYHLVNVEIPVIDEIINLCERFLPYRKFPEKAFDVLDFICAKYKNISYKHPQDILDLEEKLYSKLHPNIKKGSREYKALEKISDRLGKKIGKWAENIANNPPVITSKDLISAFAEKFKITENQLHQTHTHGLSDIADRIKTEVHGQDHAIEQVCDILACTKVGLRDKTKPLGKFLFVGSTSTGKTWLSKKIAKYYFADEKALIRLDMSEFQEKYSVSALIGSTAGYIGYENGGRLTEFVKHNPSSVILFDEIEKASPDIVNLLLQIMDEGCLTDGQGYRVDFTNTIIVMTGNLGQEGPKRSMGFLNDKKPDENYVLAVKKHFKPELLARVDEIIVFRDVDEKMMRQIIQDSIDRSISSLMGENIVLTIDPSVVDYLLNLAKQQDAHARNIHSIVRKNLEIPLARILLKDRPKAITAKIEKEKLILS